MLWNSEFFTLDSLIAHASFCSFIFLKDDFTLGNSSVHTLNGVDYSFFTWNHNEIYHNSEEFCLVPIRLGYGLNDESSCAFIGANMSL